MISELDKSIYRLGSRITIRKTNTNRKAYNSSLRLSEIISTVKHDFADKRAVMKSSR